MQKITPDVAVCSEDDEVNSESKAIGLKIKTSENIGDFEKFCVPED